MFGGNVGHVSIEMILPSTEQIRAMIEKYCMKETFEQWKMKKSTASENATFNEYIKRSIKILPVRFVGHEVKRSVFNVRGKLKKDRFKNASEISYYKIDFSFWPGEHDPFYCSNIEEDMVNGRKGRHFEYSDVAKEYLQPEERIHRGVIGKRSMTYAPTIIAHQRDINDKEFERIRQAIELQKLTETLKVEELLSNKIENLKDQKIDDSLRKICLNIGLEIDLLVKEYMNANPLKRREKVNVEKFKEFFLQKINAHFSNLYSKNKQLKQKFKKEKPYLSQDKYFTRGVYPDHTQELPYRTETSRGLDPEAMLKKMREITKLGALKFNIHTNNCSKASTAVLKAGAVHDPLLECVLGEEVLGFIGTPQQVIENAQRANYILAHDKQNTLFTRIANSDK